MELNSSSEISLRFLREDSQSEVIQFTEEEEEEEEEEGEDENHCNDSRRTDSFLGC